ncbi:hypothetical protein ALP12_200182 [Pseudomonas savastanoi pv. phaseolicola]|uniref:AHH domain-containing protein n=1 Tax=Pseudomonas savastanoi TaxID=29438 RepID=UPI000EFDF8C3|nr:AHH domain-containing protein [Pseudomonas savastanoi]RMV28978.1 hypothetical protein ALP12_200182 [Pseudomonas savastanoi pv. phaseolicola]
MQALSGFQKHHIIPQQLATHEAIKAAGMNIHKVSNIIYLPKYAESHPTRTVHRGSHAEYTARIEKKLDVASDYGKVNGWSKGDYEKVVNGIIADERKGLRSGTTKLNSASVRGIACG